MKICNDNYLCFITKLKVNIANGSKNKYTSEKSYSYKGLLGLLVSERIRSYTSFERSLNSHRRCYGTKILLHHFATFKNITSCAIYMYIQSY